MHERENALKEWLKAHFQSREFTLKPLAGDASFRRYFRVQQDKQSYVAMDAPPEKENLIPFLDILQRLEQNEVHVPEVLAQDLSQGFLLLSDLGDDLLLNQLNSHTVNAYYQEALNTLLKIQDCSKTDLVPFDKSFMLKEMALCKDWFFKAYLQLDLTQEEEAVIAKAMEWIADEVEKQPKTFIHRDYHSRNLMCLKNQNQLGVIDFQDAMYGPLTYDLVSLLKDCYIAWPREQVIQWLYFSYQQTPTAAIYSFEEYTQAFDLCGLQRHLKVLGVFCRLHLRDNKSTYLNDLPQTLKYALECMESYPPLHSLYQFFQTRVQLA